MSVPRKGLCKSLGSESYLSRIISSLSRGGSRAQVCFKGGGGYSLIPSEISRRKNTLMYFVEKQRIERQYKEIYLKFSMNLN